MLPGIDNKPGEHQTTHAFSANNRADDNATIVLHTEVRNPTKGRNVIYSYCKKTGHL